MRTAIIITLTILLLPLTSFAEFPEKSLYNLEMHWTDQNEKPATLSDLSGQYVVTSMMYLTCKASCPLTLQKLKTIERDLKQAGKEAHFVVISFDPATDTPVSMAKFKADHKLSDKWHFLNGSEQDVRKMALLLGFNYQKIEGSRDFNHSNRISVLSKQGEILATIDRLDGLNSVLLEKVKS